MAKGDVQPGGRRRLPPDAARIAARVAKHCGPCAGAECVQPLNAGFFALERMRMANVQERKLRKQKRQKATGK